jgi:hypothetical protein
MCYYITVKLTIELFALSGSGCRFKVGHNPRVFGINPGDIVRYCHILVGIKNNTKVAMSAAVASRWKAGGVAVH